MLPAIQMLFPAWYAVMTKTVLNSFQKSKVLSESQKATIAEDYDPFKELEVEIVNLRSIQPDLVSKNIDAVGYKGSGCTAYTFLG